MSVLKLPKKIHRFSQYALSSLLWLTLIVGCRTSTTPPSDRLRDDLNRPVSVTPPVSRIITLAPSLTELTFSAGAGSLLVAVTTADDFPPAVDSLPRFSALPLNIEQIVAFQPQLVLATTQINRLDEAEQLERLGIPVYFFTFQSIKDIPRVIRQIGWLAGTDSTATKAAQQFEVQLKELQTKVAHLHHPRVLLLIGDQTLYAFGGNSYVHEAIQIAGGESITAHFDQPAIILTEEFILKAQPDVIIGLWGSAYASETFLAFHPSLRQTPAAQNRRIFSLPAAWLARPGPRILLGIKQMARIIHPEAFSPALQDSLVSSK